MNCGFCGLDDHTTEEHDDYMAGLNDQYGGLGQPDTEVQYVDVPPSQYEDMSPQPDYEPVEDQMPGAVESEYEVIPPQQKQTSATRVAGVAQDLMTLAQSASSGDASTILSAVEQFSKSQMVRFLDVSIIGPLMLYWAYRGKLSKGERFVLGLMGLGTVIYNGRNYMANKKVVQPKELAAIKHELQSTMLSGR